MGVADIDSIETGMYAHSLDGVNDEVNILHISDLHFGIEKANDPSIKFKINESQQQDALLGLWKTLEDDMKVPPNWKPDIVVVSGDIAWVGSEDEYEKYKKKFVEPLTNLGISEDKIITCPGNHDIIRDKARGYERPLRDSNTNNLEEITREAIENVRKDHFLHYVSNICKGDPGKLCYSISFSSWPWLTFALLNSAWDWRKDHNEASLRVGRNLLAEVLPSPKSKDGIVVAVFHHPYMTTEYVMDGKEEVKVDWLHWSERTTQKEGDVCFTTMLEQKADFVLNGHIHKKTEPLPGKTPGVIRLISGTAYSYDTVEFHCRILKLRKGGHPDRIDIFTNLGAGSGLWETSSPKNFNAFEMYWENSAKKQTEVSTYAEAITELLHLLRQNGELDRQRIFNKLITLMTAVYSDVEIRDKLYDASYTDAEINAAIENERVLRLKGHR